MRKLLALVLTIGVALGLSLGSAAPSAAQIDDSNGQIRWEGWSLRYQISDMFDGMSISNVRFEGTEVLSRASLPVMNVYYELSLGEGGCGPFADRLGGNEPTTVREFVQDGEKWLEIGMEDDIGAYGIYQVFYLSESGVIDAHIFSKGLQCRFFHEHIPFWRLDFDVAGSGGDQILRREGNSYVAETTEFNRPAADAAGHDWRVRDSATGREVAVYFDDGSFAIPGDEVIPETQYAENRVFGVRYASDEIKWSGGPRRDLRIVNGESINNTDLVLWYSGYMPHSPDEGAELWHSTGVRMVLDPDAAPGPDPTATSVATATATATATPTPSPTATATSTPRATSTPTPTATPRATATPTPTATPRATATRLPTATAIPAPTIRIASGDSYTFGFESGAPAWVNNPRGTDQATSGFWEQASPIQTLFNGAVLQPSGGVASARALVTQANPGRSVGTYDIDGGAVSTLSPAIAVAGGSGNLSLDWYFTHLSNSTNDDYFQITLLGSNGGRLPVVSARADGSSRPHAWSSRTVDLAGLGSSFQILVEAADGGAGSIVEAGVDNIRIEAGSAPVPTPVPTRVSTPVPVPTQEPTPRPSGSVYSQTFEFSSDWSDITSDMSQPATNGQWEVGRLQRTQWNGVTVQPAGGADGSYRALATGISAGSGVGTYDIDGGTTAAISPAIQLPASGELTLTYRRFLAHATNATADDFFSMSVRAADGSETELERLRGTSAQMPGTWSAASFDLEDWRGTTIRLIVRAADGGSGGVIEAGLDSVRIVQN